MDKNNKSNNYNIYDNKNTGIQHRNTLAYREGNAPIEGFEEIPYRFQSYTMLVLLGYFGIKIFLGAFKKYPQKYYQKNIVINTNKLCGLEGDDQQENIVMNYFVPGIWNNEIYDLIVTIILGGVTYIFTDMGRRRVFGKLGGINLAFLFGYLLGLNTVAIKPMFEDDMSENSSYKKGVNFVLTVLLIFIVVFMIMLSAKGAISLGGSIFHKGPGAYILYIIMIIVVVVGLIYTRKQSEDNDTIIYESTDVSGDQCKTKKYGGVQTSGETVNLSMTFIAWLITLIFVYDPHENYLRIIFYFINGLSLGTFVAGMSFYGCEFLLQRIPTKSCIGADDCKSKNIVISEHQDSIKNDSNIVKWLLGGLCCIVIALLIYLYYGNVIHF